MTSNADKLTIQAKYRHVEKTFSGSPEEVWLALNRFFGEFLPSFEIAKRLFLSVDLQSLVKDCEGLIAFSPEGPNLLISKSRITDNETLCLLLLANYVGYRLGSLGSDAVSKEELQLKLGKSGKITGTRLGELVKSGMIVKVSDDKYRMTTFGVVQMQRDALSRVRVKTGG